MSGGSVGVKDKYASHDVSDGAVCALYSSGFSSLDQCTVFVYISVE